MSYFLAPMQIVAKCPKCDARLPVLAEEAPAAIKCGGCGRDLPLAFTEAVTTDRGVDRCPVCRGGDFYIRKDFDPKVGLTVVIIVALALLTLAALAPSQDLDEGDRNVSSARHAPHGAEVTAMHAPHAPADIPR